MKRSMASILGCIAVLLFSVLVFAQTTEKQKAPSKPSTKTAAPAKSQAKTPPGQNKYKSFDPRDAARGGPISASLDSDRTGDCPPEPDRKPEVAYLSLSDDQYRQFVQDPQGFVNNYHVFTCPISKGMRHLTKAASKSTAKKATTPGGDPRVAVVHDPDCGGYWYDIPY